MNMEELRLVPLSQCTFEQALTLWNRGFEGYYFDMTMTLSRYVERLGTINVRPDLSVAAFVGDQPAGFALTAIKQLEGGVKAAWNAGTGVHPEFRGKGIAKRIVAETLRLLKDEGVQLATLEAISANENAQGVYERAGYRHVDDLLGLRCKTPLPEDAFPADLESGSYRFRTGKPVLVSLLPFYRKQTAWTSQWMNIAEGECLVVEDENEAPVGYALYKRNLSAAGELASITLYQCETAPDRSDAAAIVAACLKQLYAPLEASVTRSADNIRKSNTLLVQALQQAGFEKAYEQKLYWLELA